MKFIISNTNLFFVKYVVTTSNRYVRITSLIFCNNKLVGLCYTDNRYPTNYRATCDTEKGFAMFFYSQEDMLQRRIVQDIHTMKEVTIEELFCVAETVINYERNSQIAIHRNKQ